MKIKIQGKQRLIHEYLMVGKTELAYQTNKEINFVINKTVVDN